MTDTIQDPSNHAYAHIASVRKEWRDEIWEATAWWRGKWWEVILVYRLAKGSGVIGIGQSPLSYHEARYFALERSGWPEEGWAIVLPDLDEMAKRTETRIIEEGTRLRQKQQKKQKKERKAKEIS